MITYVRPDKRVLLGSVSGGADTNFVDDWLIDGRPYFPAKLTGATTWTVTPDASRNADVFAIVNHGVAAAGTVTFSIGSVVLTVPAYGEDGIALNVGQILTSPVSTGASFTVSGTDLLIGDLWVGTSETLPNFLMSRQLDPGDIFPWESGMQSSWDGYGEPRRYSGTLILNDAQYTQFLSWFKSTKRGTLPTLIYIAKDDVWLLSQFHFTAQHGEGFHSVSLEIVEIPRVSW